MSYSIKRFVLNKSLIYSTILIFPVKNHFSSAKSGITYNHEKLWSQLPQKLTHGKPYNYYPRGRVQINHGKAIIYLNPNIATEKVKQFLIQEFNLTARNGINKVVINVDGSNHYKCHLDN